MSAPRGGGRLKVGVMGVGSLGFHHARILRELPGAELVGIHDTNATRLTEVGAELGVPTFPVLDELVLIPEVEHFIAFIAGSQRGISA